MKLILNNMLKDTLKQIEEEFEKSEAVDAFRALLLEVDPSIQRHLKSIVIDYIKSSNNKILSAVEEEIKRLIITKDNLGYVGGLTNEHLNRNQAYRKVLKIISDAKNC
jgi:hypothetical protein